jgi:L-threonylcarbamoyladenylate synthase
VGSDIGRRRTGGDDRRDLVDRWLTAHHGCMPGIIRDGESPAAIAEAVAKLQAGGLVAIPTETVYGLSADAGSSVAVRRIFEVKGRPRDHPLILHIHADADLNRWSADAPEYALELVRRFWPGPLTLVLSRSEAVGVFVTGGQSTVALRAPNHPVAQDLLEGFGGAVAAPSANLFGGVSPTTARHVLADLGPRLDPSSDLILDGGTCSVGLESTILDCTGSSPRLLRPGGLGAEAIAEVVAIADSQESPTESIRVPGSLESHYSPAARVVLGEVDIAAPTPGELRRIASRSVGQGARIGLVAFETVQTPDGWTRLLAPRNTTEFAHDLYQALRGADESNLDLVVAVLPETRHGDREAGLVNAIVDRLRRAAA